MVWCSWFTISLSARLRGIEGRHTAGVHHISLVQNALTSLNPHSEPMKRSFPSPPPVWPHRRPSVSRNLLLRGPQVSGDAQDSILNEGWIAPELSFCVWLFGSRSRIFYTTALLSFMAISLWPRSSDLSSHQPDSPVLSAASTIPSRERQCLFQSHSRIGC